MSEFADIIYIPQHCLGPEEGLSQRLDDKEVPYIRLDAVAAYISALQELKNLAALETGMESKLSEDARQLIRLLGGQP